jgi:hypothetical protein
MCVIDIVCGRHSAHNRGQMPAHASAESLSDRGICKRDRISVARRTACAYCVRVSCARDGAQRGKLKAGGLVDLDAAARLVLQARVM